MQFASLIVLFFLSLFNVNFPELSGIDTIAKIDSSGCSLSQDQAIEVSLQKTIAIAAGLVNIAAGPWNALLVEPGVSRRATAAIMILAGAGAHKDIATRFEEVSRNIPSISINCTNSSGDEQSPHLTIYLQVNEMNSETWRTLSSSTGAFTSTDQSDILRDWYTVAFLRALDEQRRAVEENDKKLEDLMRKTQRGFKKLEASMSRLGFV